MSLSFTSNYPQDYLLRLQELGHNPFTMPPHPKGAAAQSPNQHRVGEHWSGANPVPTIGRFMERLQEDQREREAHERAMAAKSQPEGRPQAEGAIPHRPRKVGKGRTREVTDPTTGREIEVEDLDETAMEPVKEPTVMFLSPTMPLTLLTK